MGDKIEGTFKLDGRTWSWHTIPNKDTKNHPRSLFRTVVRSGGLTFVWVHSDPKLDPKETLKLQFLVLRDTSR